MRSGAVLECAGSVDEVDVAALAGGVPGDAVPGDGEPGVGELGVVPTAESLAALTEAELEALIVANEAQLRRREVLQALAIAEFGRRGAHRRDGHRSIVAWCRGHLRWSTARASRAVRMGEALAALPSMSERARRGEVPVDHLDDLGRVHAIERVREPLAEADSLFAELAPRSFHWQWRAALQRWLRLADADGAQQLHDAAHEARRASVHVVGEQVVLEAEGGTLDGVFLREVLDRFVQAEWLADCDEARQRLGTEQVSALDLARTHRQRTFDALMAVFRAAASAPLVQASADPLVNVIVDDDTAARLMRMVAGADTTPRIPLAFREYRCETIDGVPLSETDMAGLMLHGRLRRVLLAPDSVVIDLGRSRRLFTGGAREAAMLADQRCLWPGCERATAHCETDHLVEWARGGSTSPSNAGRACRPHNVFRSAHGYTARRDADGCWVVRRPDGSIVGDPVVAA